MRRGQVSDLIAGYGHLVLDERHHLSIARIKVSLRHIRPSIWRRIEIRADARLTFDLEAVNGALRGRKILVPEEGP